MVVPDPITIAKITITVIDELIQLGTFTANLVQDIREFESDTHQFHNLINSDISRTKLLRNLLFTESPVYGGRTLFDQIDRDVQEQTENLLEASKSILQQSHDILLRRSGSKAFVSRAPLDSVASGLSEASTLVSSAKSTRKSRPSVPSLIWWSIRDKKRVGDLIQKFNEQNSCLQEYVKLWCLASQLGMSASHLQHMQEDESSKKLGFDVDATLRLNQKEAEGTIESLELPESPWSEVLMPIKPIEHQGMFSTITVQDRHFIQENYSVHQRQLSQLSLTPNNSQLDPNIRYRVEALAKLLHQPKEQVFRILPCVGWRYLSSHDCIAMVFEVPPNSEAAPVSLLQLLNDRSKKPELGDKYRLAYGLSRCIAQLHMVRWFHESFRSDNVLLFPCSGPDTAESGIIDITSPWIFGFEFSRLDTGRTVSQPDFLPQHDIYRHPERQGVLEVSFTRLHDIYALGVVLLEIGLWESAIKLETRRFATVTPEKAGLVQDQLIKYAERRLERQVGKKYKELVLKCLKGDFGVTEYDDNKADLKLQQAFRSQVVDVLERSATSV